MSEINPDSLIQVLGMVALAVIMVFIGVQKLRKDWQSNSAESSLISLMHTELGRMGSQNTLLATELNKLQLEVVTLNKELHKLNIENQRLHAEVVALTKEVSRLQSILNSGGHNVSAS